MYLGPTSDGPVTFAAPGAGRGRAERFADAVATASPEATQELIGAAAEQGRLAAHLSSRTEALADAADARIDLVQRATGVQVKNPYRQGFLIEAQERYDAARARGEDPGPRALWIEREQRNIFNERVSAASEAAPDKGLTFGRTLEEEAGIIASNADARLAWARRDFKAAGGGVASEFIGEVAGGLWGARRDPVSVVSLVAGPGAATGRTALGRVAQSAFAQGLYNVGILALERQEVRQWRADRQQDPGDALPSPWEVGLSFAIGAIPGAAIQGVIETKAAGALKRALTGEGTGDDFASAARALGMTLDADTEAALRAGVRANTAAALARDPPPGGAALSDAAEAQALRRAADPAEAPAPLVPELRPSAEPITDAAAIAHLDNTPDPVAAVEGLRADDALFASASASERPDVQHAVRLAMLSDDAWAMVRDGQASPQHAAMVSELAARPDDHAAILARVRDANPQTPHQARAIVADAVESLSERATAESLRKRGRAAVPDNEKSLFELLASRGGLKPHGDVNYLLDGNPFVPGFGRLVREGGMTLDEAWEVAIASGHIIDNGVIEGTVNQTGQRELLRMIGEEAAGRRQYMPGFEPPPPEVVAQHRKIDRAFDSAVESGAIRDAERLRPRVRQLMIEGQDLDTALERAVMEDADRFEGRATHAGPDTQVSADAGRAPGAGEAPARTGDAGAGPGAEKDGAGSGAQSRRDGGADREPVQTEPLDLIDAVPLTREDGSVFMAGPDGIAQAGARESLFADLVRSCK
jgi:hypothetical protein